MTGVASGNDSRRGLVEGLAPRARRWIGPALAGAAGVAVAVIAAVLTSDPAGGLNTFVEGTSGSSSTALGEIGLLLPFGFAFAAGMASAALVAVAVTVGFVALFASVGLLIGAGGQAITGVFPVVGLAVGVVLIAAGAPHVGPSPTHTDRRRCILRTGKESAMTSPLILIDLGVGGMTCDDCVVHVTEALESVPGVQRADVDLATRSAVVSARPDVQAATLASAVRSTGQYNAFERRRRTRSDA